MVVLWPGTRSKEAVSGDALLPAFTAGMDVLEVPRTIARPSLGEGVVAGTRTLGREVQILVDFPRTARRLWLPWRNLKAIRGARTQFLRGRTGGKENAERLRLKTLAHAIEHWHRSTGALSRLNIDPLPHQIHLVHHILASGNLNWLIADDVGLGKTIEVGMLISALAARRRAGRVLLITPAGLVHQWQEELHQRFGLSDFQVYGKDFRVQQEHLWKQYDRVIGSMDLLKSEAHLNSLLKSEPWDLVIFDEAHRLSRRLDGTRLLSSDRFRLAAALRDRTDSMLLLSATPHQGQQDRFQALLELLRPDLKNAITDLDRHSGLLRQMVIRNRKEDVTLMDGTFVFKGKRTYRVSVDTSTEDSDFDKALRGYVRDGYRANERRRGQSSAIGFVMTTYRKLASSSVAAIHVALERRLRRLKDEHGCAVPTRASIEDERWVGELEEKRVETHDRAAEFFEGEIAALTDLVQKARSRLKSDTKLAGLLHLIDGGLPEGASKVVLFTEYRATQSYLDHTLREKFGDGSVAIINGSQSFDERERAIREFDEQRRFLISTEAGGEGLNMHRRCHVMINYDLPWNPMRLVQRVGRLYRYGQQKTVVVFNMHAPQTVDARVVSVMYERIGQVVEDMSGVSSEFKEGLEDDLLGELVNLLDVGPILEEASMSDETRTAKRLEEALAKARAAVGQQRKLFEHAAGFDPSSMDDRLVVDMTHVESFVRGVCALEGTTLAAVRGRKGVFRLAGECSTSSSVVARSLRGLVTFDREIAAAEADVDVLDMESPLLVRLLDRAKSHDFSGLANGVAGLHGKAMVTAILRWQNDQGVRLREDFAAVLLDENGEAQVNPAALTRWLRDGTGDADIDAESTSTRSWLETSWSVLDERLAESATRDLHPEGMEMITGAWFAS